MPVEEVASSVSEVYDAVDALAAAPDAESQRQRRCAATRERARLKQEESKHAARLSKMALASRHKHRGNAFKKHGISDRDFDLVANFLREHETISVLGKIQGPNFLFNLLFIEGISPSNPGTTATSRYDAEASASRNQVLTMISKPLKASAEAVAEAKKKQKPRRQGVPNTKWGLAAPQMLKEIEEIKDRKARGLSPPIIFRFLLHDSRRDYRTRSSNAGKAAEALEAERTKVLNKATAAENLQMKFEDNIQGIVDKLLGGSAFEDLPVTNQILLVRWLQMLAGPEAEPMYKVKSTYTKTETALRPLVDEYARLKYRLPQARMDSGIRDLRRSANERKAALAAAVAAAAAAAAPDEDEDAEWGRGGD